MRPTAGHLRTLPHHLDRSPRRAPAVTLIELLIVITVLALLSAVTIAGISKARRGRSTAVCVANLHAIGIAFASYAADHLDAFPPPSTDAQWEDLLRAYLHRPSFKCPADAELFDALGSSYDWRDTGDDRTTLAGKNFSNVFHQDASLAFDILPGWHAPARIQVLAIDASVNLVSQDDFFKDMQRSPTQR